MPTAIVTGASRGLGFELTRALLREGRRVVIDARGVRELEAAERTLAELGDVVAVRGNVTDPDHRAELLAAAGPALDVLVNNASVLGPSPQPPLASYPVEVLEYVYRVNVVAPLALVQLALPHLAPGAVHRRHRRRCRPSARGEPHHRAASGFGGVGDLGAGTVGSVDR